MVWRACLIGNSMPGSVSWRLCHQGSKENCCDDTRGVHIAKKYYAIISQLWKSITESSKLKLSTKTHSWSSHLPFRYFPVEISPVRFIFSKRWTSLLTACSKSIRIPSNRSKPFENQRRMVKYETIIRPSLIVQARPLIIQRGCSIKQPSCPPSPTTQHSLYSRSQWACS